MYSSKWNKILMLQARVDQLLRKALDGCITSAEAYHRIDIIQAEIIEIQKDLM